MPLFQRQLKSACTRENDRSTLCRMTTTSPQDIREHLLDITEQLIYQQGIHATGMDLLVKTSGISRKTLYRYFTNKEQLCAAALRRRDLRWMAWFKGEVRKDDDPAQQILAMFTALKSWFSTADFRGCAFINTAGETREASHPVREIAREHKQKIEQFAAELCQQAGLPNPDFRARQLLVLIDGAITVAMLMNDPSAADSARQLARQLIVSPETAGEDHD